MIFGDVLVEITRKYPECEVRELPRNAKYPSEFIVVPEPTEKHSSWSMGISYVRFSHPHHHKKICELYIVERGEIQLFIGKESFILGVGNWRIVPKGASHWMQITENCLYAVVRIYSNPGWTQEDHFIDKEAA